MWNWLVWATLAVAVVATVAAATKLVVDGLRLWRDFKRARRRIFRELDALAAKTEVAERRASTLAGESAQLTAALARLNGSLSRLAVLRQAADEATGTFGWLLALKPRKGV